MTFDPDWLERQYNNRARVPESAQILARWAEASAQVRQRLPAHLDLAYGSQPTETLDVFLPSSPGKGQAPVLFFVHGGWWRALDKSDHSWLAPRFVSRARSLWCPTMRCAQRSLSSTLPCK